MRSDALARIEGASGCSFSRDAVGGLHRGECPDLASKVAVIDSLAWEHSRDPRIDRLSLEIVHRLPSLEPAALIRALVAFVQQNVRFLREGFERFRDPFDTLELGVGDCDDHVILLLSLARALGLTGRVELLLNADGSGHVCAQLWDGASFVWCETTIPGAVVGENPRAAKQRVHAADRHDIGGQLGDLDANLAYGAKSIEALQAVTMPDVNGDLSDPAKFLHGTFSSAASTLLGKALSSVNVGGVEAAVLNTIFDVGRKVVDEVITQISTELVKAVGKDAAQVIPVVGAIASIVIDLATSAQASGLGPSSKTQSIRADYCRTQFAPVTGSGPGMAVLPADYFAGDAFNGYGENVASSVGYALRVITETSLSASMSFGKDKNGNEVVIPRPGSRGVPVARQAVFQKLRTAIEASWKVGDGGAMLFPLYLDLIRHELESGHLTKDICAQLMHDDPYNLDSLDSRVSNPGETCWDYERRALDGALTLVQAWKQTAQPFYIQFPAPGSAQLVAQGAASAAKLATPRKRLMVGLAVKPANTGSAAVQDASLRTLLLSRWSVAPGAPLVTLASIQAVHAIARLEGGDVRSLGSVHCATAECKAGAKSGQCPPGTVLTTDHTGTGTPFEVCLYQDSSPAQSADRFLHELFRRPPVVAVLDSGDADAISKALYDTTYTAGTGGEPYKAEYARRIAVNAEGLAKNLGEAVAVKRAGSSSVWWWLGGAVVVGAAGTAAYVYRDPLIKAARRLRDRV